MRAPTTTVRYAEHPDGVIDLHLPGAGRATLVLLIHGGFWRPAWDRTHTRPMAAALREAGFAVATPEYRRAGSGGWPETFDDLRSALRIAPGAVRDLGVEPRGVVAVGHSAGGQLALWLAGEADAALDRVVALSPVGDLADAAAHGIGGTAIADFLGGPLPQADPAARFRRCDPVCPITIVHGDADADVPWSHTERWAVGDPRLEVSRLPGIGHMDLIDPDSRAWPAVVAAIGAGGGPD